MTRLQAEKIVEKMEKEGFSHREGHYHYGYMTLSYNREKDVFECKREDHGTNMYEPHISYRYFGKEEFVSYLLENDFRIRID